MTARLPALRRWLAARWPSLIVAAAPAVLFAPFLFGQQVFYWGTPLLQFYPWRRAALDMLRAGRLPLWNPWVGNGAPLLANYQSALLYPPNWLALAMPLDLALNWLLVLHVMWAGVGMAALARRLGYRPLGQAVAGLAFGLSQYVVARAGFYSINAAVAWLPWVVWAGEGMVNPDSPIPGSKSPRTGLQSLLTLSLCLTLQLLAGHAQTTWYTGLLLAAWVGWRLLAAPKPERGARLRVAARLLPAAVALAVLIASAQLWPTAELLRQSPRADAAEREFVMTYSLSPWRLLTFLAPDLLGNPARGRFYGYGNYWEDALYVGLIPFLFGLAAAARALRRRAEDSLPLFLALAALASVILALGRNTPVFPFLYDHVPTFNLFQAPARMLVWAVFALALLGGWGVDRWEAAHGRARYWANLGAAGAVSVTLTALAAMLAIPPTTRVNQQLLTVAGAVLALGVNLSLLAALALLKGRLPERAWQALVVVCLAGDLVYAGAGLNPGAPADLYRAPTATGPALARALDGRRLFQFPEDEYRVKFDAYFSFFSFGPPELAREVREAQLPNAALLDGVAAAGNFDPLVSARYAAFVEVVSQTRSVKLLNLMNVGALASSTPLEGDVIARAETVTFYRAPGEPRRVWVVYSARILPDREAARAAVADPAFDPGAVVILEADQPGVPATGSPPRAVDPADPDRMALTVTLERDGWVVLADTYYPGWLAWVDGAPAAVRPADLAFRAVALPAGTHSLIFSYEPASFRWGAGLTGLGLAAWLALALWRWRGSRSA